MIRSVCGAYELLFFDVESKKQDPSGASSTKDTTWHTSTAKFGWSVDGIYPVGCDGTHINSVDLSEDHKLYVTGDDFGGVNLYNNPVRKEGYNNGRIFKGHSEHVTKVKFTKDSRHILSVGGLDQTVI